MPNKKDKKSKKAAANEGNKAIKLQSVFFEGKPYSMKLDEFHMPRAAVKLLKHLQSLIGHCTENGFPEWKEIDVKSAIGEYCADEVVELGDRYNRVAKPFAATWTGSYNTDNLGDWGNIHCSDVVASEITMLAYEMAVPRPTALNKHYRLWTEETYGETNLMQMASILDEANITKKDVFVDLGCGVGQLVMFTSAFAQCKKCVGIELSDFPFSCAEKLEGHFKDLMKFFGKRYSKFELHHGDILDPKYRDLLMNEATVIFINNLLFPDNLMLRIKSEILQGLKPGVRIITTKKLGDLKKKSINYRSINDITSMSDTVMLTSMQEGVSWTCTPVPFYLTTMNPAKLQQYYERRQSEVEAAEAAAAARRGKKRRTTSANTSTTSSSTPEVAPTPEDVTPEVTPAPEVSPEDSMLEEPEKKRRGRPRKSEVAEIKEEIEEDEEEEEDVVKYEDVSHIKLEDVSVDLDSEDVPDPEDVENKPS